jgi:hypothetical protein
VSVERAEVDRAYLLARGAGEADPRQPGCNGSANRSVEPQRAPARLPRVQIATIRSASSTALRSVSARFASAAARSRSCAQRFGPTRGRLCAARNDFTELGSLTRQSLARLLMWELANETECCE